MERVSLAIYEILEDELPRFSSLWAVYRLPRGDVDTLYGRAMDALSVLSEVMEIYETQDRRSRSLDQVGSDAAAVSAHRREMIKAVSDFSEMIRVLVKQLDIASRRLKPSA